MRGIPMAFSFKSMIAGYLRVWGPIAAMISLVTTISGVGSVSVCSCLRCRLSGASLSSLTIGLIAVTTIAFVALGKLSLEEKRQRAVYALQPSRHFVDPADMGPARAELRSSLLGTIHERARGLAATGYRLNADPTQAWPHLALDPTQHDDALITSAFTLARIEASTAEGPWKMQMEQLHDQLWQRIARANPPYLQRPSDPEPSSLRTPRRGGIGRGRSLCQQLLLAGDRGDARSPRRCLPSLRQRPRRRGSSRCTSRGGGLRPERGRARGRDGASVPSERRGRSEPPRRR